MSDSLGIYLQDHLAGAAYAIDLVEFMRDRHENDELGQFAARLLGEIKADRDILRQLAERTAAGSSPLKEFTAWLTEKVSRMKLRHEAEDGLGLFEALEFLALGITGKSKLWRALDVAAESDPRLRRLNFQHLAARAEMQHAQVEKWRLQVAHAVFATKALGNSRRSQKTRSHDASRAESSGVRGKTITGGVLLAAALVAAVGLAPDVVRYMKIRSM
jgi:hypothetical protein